MGYKTPSLAIHVSIYVAYFGLNFKPAWKRGLKEGGE
jgi:hypothetical protein